jgi:GT2 family glycosyltransferase
VSASAAGVSFLVPVRDGERWLPAVLEAILAQRDGHAVEVIAVDDGSRDGSGEILRAFAARGAVRVLAGNGRGAAAAINQAIRAAVHPILCQIDQDMILEPGWLERIRGEFAHDRVAAVQGYFVTPRPAGFWARISGLDLEDRLAGIRGIVVEQAASGNAAYRAEAVRAIGLFDESLGYGYDNDMSYRLRAAGWELRFCRGARAVHRWRETLGGHLAHQYGVGYGRLDLLRKHPQRLGGDTNSGWGMMLHAGGTAAALTALLAAPLAPPAGAWGAGLLALLAAERLAAGLRATVRFRDPLALAFPLAHLARDLAWVAALLVWTGRRLLGRPSSPRHSMR